MSNNKASFMLSDWLQKSDKMLGPRQQVQVHGTKFAE